MFSASKGQPFKKKCIAKRQELPTSYSYSIWKKKLPCFFFLHAEEQFFWWCTNYMEKYVCILKQKSRHSFFKKNVKLFPFSERKLFVLQVALCLDIYGNAQYAFLVQKRGTFFVEFYSTYTYCGPSLVLVLCTFALHKLRFKTIKITKHDLFAQ